MRITRCPKAWSTSCASWMACSRCATCPSMSEEIARLRIEIDRLDEELAAALNKRAELAKRIGVLKGGAAPYRPERESEILRRVAQKGGALGAERLTAVFREIISACRGLEEAIRVSYLGPEGTFS